MLTHYDPLPTTRLPHGATYHQLVSLLPDKVKLDYPATDVMTDLKRVAAVTIEPAATMGAANQKMIQHGIRLLLVIDEDKGVLGIVTATDVLGEKPIKLIRETGVSRQEILVRDIMASRDTLEVLDMDAVSYAKVGNIVATLRKSGRQHALVVDGEGPAWQVCGIFSTSQIANQLGMPIDAPEVARNFAEIEVQLSK
ncbi:MAG: CBS domain-containing protein [Burkholderiales bacterium]